MKKIFGTLTLTLSLIAMVSCGGKKEDNSAAQVDPVKAQAESFYKATLAADENDDYEAMKKLNAEIEAYYNDLSDEDKAKFEKYVLEIVEEEMGDDVDEYVDDAYESAKKSMDDAYESAEKSMDDAYDYAEKSMDDAYDYAEKSMNDAYDYAEKSMNDAYDYAEKSMDDAYDYAEKAMDNAYDYADDVTDDAYKYAEKAVEEAYEYAEKALEDAIDYSGGFDW